MECLYYSEVFSPLDDRMTRELSWFDFGMIAITVLALLVDFVR